MSKLLFRVIILSAVLCSVSAAVAVDTTDYTSEWSFGTGAPVSDLGPGALVGVGTSGDGLTNVGGLDCMHFGPHSGASTGYELRVNTPADPTQFTMIFDLFVAADNSDSWLPLFNGNGSNSNDADLFLRPGTGGYYSGGYFDSPTVPWVKGQWNRFVYVDDYTNSTSTVYVNGVHSATFAPADYIYSGNPTPAWLLTDNDGETTDAYILNFAFIDELLTADDAAELGGVNAEGIFDVASPYPYNPVPKNGAKYVDPSTDVSCTEPDTWTPVAYDVWFGPEGNMTKVRDKQAYGATISYDPPGDLLDETTYEWQVNPYDPNTEGTQIPIIVNPGSVWSFKTNPADAMIGHWTLDPSDVNGTTAVDTSGLAHDGTLMGAGFTDANTIEGYDLLADGALSFKGDDDYISLLALDPNSGAMTITAWVKADSSYAEDWPGIVFNRGASAAGISLLDTELRYHWNGGNYGWSSGLNVTLGEWAFVALVVEPSQATLYVDGNSATNTVSHSPEAFDVDDELRIGSDGGTGRFFDGGIDDVRIYNYALTSSEIAVFYGNLIMTSQPQSATVADGTPLTLSVTASSSGGNLTYQWYDQDGTLTEASPYTGTTLASLDISGVGLTEEGNYYCEVTDNNGTTTSDIAVVLTERQVGWWKLDDASGTVAADSATSSLPPNTGTVMGTNDGPPGWTTGQDVGALSFDGNRDPGLFPTRGAGDPNTDYVDCGSNYTLKPSTAVTVSAWYKTDTDTYSYYGQLAGLNFDEGSSEGGYAILIDNYGGNNVKFFVNGGSGGGFYIQTSNVPDTPTGWTYVAATYDGTTMRLYVNGTEEATSTTQSGNINYNYTDSFKIGLYSCGNWWEPFEGEIDDVQVYNYAMEPNDIKDMYGLPQVLTDPQNTTVAAGDPATFTVSADGPVGVTLYYQWFKVGGSSVSSPSDSPLLTIDPVAIGDEGLYYCNVAKNALMSSPVSSETAVLLTERLISHWTFDTGDGLTDVEGTNDGVAFGPSGPSYEVGIVGDKALSLSGSEPNEVVVVSHAYELNSIKSTIALWAKAANGGSGTWRAAWDSRSEDGSSTYGGNLYASTSDTWQYWTGNPGELSWNSVGTADVNDVWVFVVSTYDSETLEKKIYVDGLLQDEVTLGAPYRLNPSPNPLGIGGRASGGALFNGLIDDVMIYSYAIDKYEVAELYGAATPGWWECFDPPRFDTNDDCIVTLIDFAEVAAKYLDCNWYDQGDCP